MHTHLSAVPPWGRARISGWRRFGSRGWEADVDGVGWAASVLWRGDGLSRGVGWAVAYLVCGLNMLYFCKQVSANSDFAGGRVSTLYCAITWRASLRPLGAGGWHPSTSSEKRCSLRRSVLTESKAASAIL